MLGGIPGWDKFDLGKYLDPRDQDDTLEGYWESGAVKNKDDERSLHMFFSPNRIPKGLTNSEVSIVIALFPIREKQIERASAQHRSSELPASFRPAALIITRAEFAAGIAEFLAGYVSSEGPAVIDIDATAPKPPSLTG
ncbi:MAG: hypothetical protein WC763_01795 [Candidatus Paceibacterota bacterium]|jgi:hypothetical protein